MTRLTAHQMDAAQGRTPVALKALESPSGPITFSVTPIDGVFALASVPFEVVGAHEVHETLSAAIARMLECASAVSRDEFPPAQPVAERAA